MSTPSLAAATLRPRPARKPAAVFGVAQGGVNRLERGGPRPVPGIAGRRAEIARHLSFKSEEYEA